MIAAVDRIVEDIAICEELATEHIIKLNIKDLPKNLKEGDVITASDGQYVIDDMLTIERRMKMAELVSKLPR